MKTKFAALAALVALPPAARASIAIVGGMTYEFSVEPGGSYEGVVTVKNLEKVPAEAKLYQTDYLFYADGRNLYGAPGSAPRSNSKWIALTDDFVRVPPGQTASVSYKIRVPKGAGQSGTYWSLIMVEEGVPPPRRGAAPKDKISLGVRNVMRYAIQVITHFGESGEASVKILSKRIAKAGKRRIFEVDIENTGERLLKPDVRAEFFDLKGNLSEKQTAVKKRIFPGTSIRQEFDVSKLPKGAYKALVTIDSGDDNVFGAQADLKLD